jgi:hypothetical protein
MMEKIVCNFRLRIAMLFSVSVSQWPVGVIIRRGDKVLQRVKHVSDEDTRSRCGYLGGEKERYVRG